LANQNVLNITINVQLFVNKEVSMSL